MAFNVFFFFFYVNCFFFEFPLLEVVRRANAVAISAHLGATSGVQPLPETWMMEEVHFFLQYYIIQLTK